MSVTGRPQPNAEDSPAPGGSTDSVDSAETDGKGSGALAPERTAGPGAAGASPASGHDGRLGRFERRVLGPGRDPDPRYSLANERTFLAWIRTSLTLLGGGVAIEAFAGDAIDLIARRALALSLICLGMALAATASYRWVNRHGFSAALIRAAARG